MKNLGRTLVCVSLGAVLGVFTGEWITSIRREGDPPKAHDPIYQVDRDEHWRHMHDEEIARVRTWAPTGWRFQVGPEPFMPDAFPLVLWCVDDAGRIVPLAPDLVRRGRVVAIPFGWTP